jgi:hypothetical protein
MGNVASVAAIREGAVRVAAGHPATVRDLLQRQEVRGLGVMAHWLS